MKKLLRKVRRQPSEAEQPQRITNDTIAEHRERILAGGRRFKYPVQYARHKLVINATLIGLGSIILLIVLGWWQLYVVQNTSDFMYRVTRVIPVPVASVDGQPVRYSDYLMKYRSSIHYLVEKEQVNLSTEDGQRQSDFVKNQAMEDAIADAYAVKLAEEQGITVSAEELETFLRQQRTSSDGEVTEATYNAVIEDYYGWSPEEYREAMESKLLRQKVSFAIDADAKTAADLVGEAIEGGETNFEAVVAAVNEDSPREVVYGALGFLPRTNQDGGLTEAASRLEVGQISAPVQSTTGEGYYYIKLLEANRTQVSYEFIQVPLIAFIEQIREITNREDGVREFITIPEIETPTQ